MFCDSTPNIIEREFPIIGITPDLLKWIKVLKENYQTHYDTISRSICEELNEEANKEELNEEENKEANTEQKSIHSRG